LIRDSISGRDRVLPYVLEEYGWGAHGYSLIVLFLKEAKKRSNTAGQERFHTLMTSYYRGAVGIVFVYDMTDEKSFDSITKWLRYIELHASQDMQKILLANKCDVID
uniref:GTP-binding protein n=1 Tax=Parascaris univalens TaxID=6257 RepID=A0A915A3K9_PARUN